jgi:hypothetical protein
MSLRRILFPALAVGILLFAMPSATAQPLQFIFHFDTLQIDVHPEGVPKTSPSEPNGAALVLYIRNVTIDGWNAVDLRYCMDKNDYCPFQLGSGNRDGMVSAQEVKDFQEAATIFMGGLQDVKNLTNIIRNNVTIDGKTAAMTPKVRALRFEGAEGPIDSDKPFGAFVDVKAVYETDVKARTHQISVTGLNLKELGFAYSKVIWDVKSENSWSYQATETKPAAAVAKVSPGGWFSNQSVFESYTQQGLSLSIKMDGRSGGKSPGLEAPLLLLGLVVAVMLGRRRL